jgi:hypothetical protein
MYVARSVRPPAMVRAIVVGSQQSAAREAWELQRNQPNPTGFASVGGAVFRTSLEATGVSGTVFPFGNEPKIYFLGALMEVGPERVITMGARDNEKI